MSEYFLLGNKKFVPELPPLYFHKEDIESHVFVNDDGDYALRGCAVGGCPAVFTLLEPNLKVNIDQHWQYYLIAINYAMALDDISSILDTALAFCNGTGIRSEPLRNYILNKDLDALDSRNNPAYPKFDKDRTCSRSTLTGTDIGGGIIKLVTFNGNQPPPLKPGRTYPTQISDIRLDDYLYNPQTHPWMFFVANRVTAVRTGSSVAPFPRGAIYSWTGDGLPYTWLPHVSRHIIYYPSSKLVRVDKVLSPYRIVR